MKMMACRQWSSKAGILRSYQASRELGAHQMLQIELAMAEVLRNQSTENQVGARK
jgi:hypothetical protein